MEQAAARGLNVVRTWAHSSDTQFPFQVGVVCGGGRGSAWALLGTAWNMCVAPHGLQHGRLLTRR